MLNHLVIFSPPTQSKQSHEARDKRAKQFINKNGQFPLYYSCLSVAVKAAAVHSMNKTNLADFCLTGFLQPRARLSKVLSWLTFLQPNHFPLVSFQSLPFLLSSLLSLFDPLTVPAPLEKCFHPPVSFGSSAAGVNCPLLCHSTPAL